MNNSTTIFSTQVTIPNDFFAVHFSKYPTLRHVVNVSVNSEGNFTNIYDYVPSTSFAQTYGMSKVIHREFRVWHYLKSFLGVFGRGYTSSGTKLYSAIDNTIYYGEIDYVIDENTLMLKEAIDLTAHFNPINMISCTPSTDYNYSMARGMNGRGGTWADHERSKGVFDWTDVDKTTNFFLASNRTVLFTVFGTPPWAATHPDEPTKLWGPNMQMSPPKLQDWIDYCTALATHVNGRVDHFEIWNEPNFPWMHGVGIIGQSTIQVRDNWFNVTNGTILTNAGIAPGAKIVMSDFATRTITLSLPNIASFNGDVIISEATTRIASAQAGTYTITVDTPLITTFYYHPVSNVYLFDQIGVPVIYTVASVSTESPAPYRGVITLNESMLPETNAKNWYISRNGDPTIYTIFDIKRDKHIITVTEPFPVGTDAIGWTIYQQEPISYQMQGTASGNTLTMGQSLPFTEPFSTWQVTRTGYATVYHIHNVTTNTILLHELIPSGTAPTDWHVSRTGDANTYTVSSVTTYTITTTEKIRGSFTNHQLTILSGSSYFTGTSEQLSEITRLASQAIKAVIPNAKIVSPPPSNILHGYYQGNGSKSLAKMLDSSAAGMVYRGTNGAGTKMKDWVDIIAYHTYQPAVGIPLSTHRVRQELAKIGVADTVELWDTEFGVPMLIGNRSEFTGSISLINGVPTLNVSSVVNTTGYNITVGDAVHSTTVAFSGSISGTTLTAGHSGASWFEFRGTLAVGQVIRGVGIADGTTITQLLSGTGKQGTYQVNISQTVSTAGVTIPIYVDSVVAEGTIITALGTGTGKEGTYVVSINQEVPVVNGNMITLLSLPVFRDKTIKLISRIIMCSAFGGCSKTFYYQYDDPQFGSSDPVVIAGVSANINFIRGKTLMNLSYANTNGVLTYNRTEDAVMGAITATFTDGTSITV